MGEIDDLLDKAKKVLADWWNTEDVVRAGGDYEYAKVGIPPTTAVLTRGQQVMVGAAVLGTLAAPIIGGGTLSGTAAVGAKAVALGEAFPDRPMPRDRFGRPVPETDAPHTRLGRQEGRQGSYPQAREFDAHGNPVRDIDFTDHGRGHPNPHQHRYEPNPTGGTPRRGSHEPLGGT